MGPGSVLVGILAARNAASAIVSASIAFEDIKFFIKLILAMLFAMLILQYRSSRRNKKLLKKVELLGRQLKQVAMLDKRVTNAMDQLDDTKKHNTLVHKQLEQLAYWSGQQQIDMRTRFEELSHDMGRLIHSLGDIQMRISALSFDIQLAQRAGNIVKLERPTEDESIGGSEHCRATPKKEFSPALTDNEAAAVGIITTRPTALDDEYDEGTDWESVAIRIDHHS